MDTSKETVIHVQEIEPRLRHLTIFQVFDSLAEGESLLIHNNHDPKPVFYQLQELRGDTFTWDYVQAGPQWWDIRVTKKSNIEQATSISPEGDVIINIPLIEPKLKHPTIFEVFDNLGGGESLIIHNDHDPKPVYFQLLGERGDVFTWQYLEQGPEWWDVRVTKKGKPHPIRISEQGSIIINIPAIEPKLKHPTIFQVFDNLAGGESLIIHNDHDPKPVYYQLLGERGDVFTWQYLEQGPQWWDVRVTKKGGDVQTQSSTKEDIVIDVPSIEPKLKHPTIFEVFDKLNGGESLIIHNDHDPKPVYYQLLGERGDVFTWQYLDEGPQWWNVRVTKKGGDVQTQASTSSTKEDIVIDVPSIEPKLKHPTIFQVFDELASGESLIIHNDHDPKPVYYQLLGERGDVFTWQYLDEGPQWWNVRITKKGKENVDTIGNITAKDLRKAQVFKKYGLDFSCGGKKTVKEACKEKGIDSIQVEKELQDVNYSVTGGNINYNDWNIDFLADYIVQTHHHYIRKYLPELRGYATKVAQVHGQQHPELLSIRDLIEELQEDLQEHLVFEEKTLFPWVKTIVQAKNNNIAYPKKEKSFEYTIKEAEKEHETVGNNFEEIRQLSQNFALPEDACASYQLLYKMLEEFEGGLQTQIHLENNILFPKTVELEKTLI